MESRDEPLHEQRLEAGRLFRGDHYAEPGPFENYHARMAELQQEARETQSPWHSERILREVQHLTDQISRETALRGPVGFERWIPSDLSQWAREQMERLYAPVEVRPRREMEGLWSPNPWQRQETPVAMRVAGVDMAERTVTVESVPPAPETLNDNDRRRIEAMNTEGQKVHITTRDGYKKTIRMNVMAGSERVSLAEMGGPPLGRVALDAPLTESIPVRRRDFEIVRKGVFYDLRTRATTTEYWAVER